MISFTVGMLELYNNFNHQGMKKYRKTRQKLYPRNFCRVLSMCRSPVWFPDAACNQSILSSERRVKMCTKIANNSKRADYEECIRGALPQRGHNLAESKQML